MQNEFELKKLMCEIGRRVYNRGMVAANDGNFSVKLNEISDHLLKLRCTCVYMKKDQMLVR